MPDTTFEERKRCPKCGTPGRESRMEKLRNESRLYTIMCVKEDCKWFDTGWVVQVMKDGSIPERQPQEKDYPEMPTHVRNQAMRDIEMAKATNDGDEDAAYEFLGDRYVPRGKPRP